MLHFGAAEDQPCVERQPLFAPDLAVKAVQDARRFIDRSGAHRLAEDPGRVRGPGVYIQLPAARAAACDHGASRSVPVTRAALEPERHVCLPARLQERGARHLQRSAWRFFVARHDDSDVGALQRTHARQRFQRLDDHDVAALHVRDPGSFCNAVVQSFEALKRAVLFKDGVKVPDQQQLLASGRAVSRAKRSDEVAAPAHFRGERGVTHLKPQPLQFRRKDIVYSPHTPGIQRSAVDVNGTLEQLDGLCSVPVDIRGDPSLFG